MRGVVLAGLLALAGCKSEAPLEACAAGTTRSGGACVPCGPSTTPGDGGECIPIGVRADLCAPEMPFAEPSGACEPILHQGECPLGTMPRIGTSECEAVGVATCGEGFVADGTGGCRVSFGDVVCKTGTMAIPGDTACRAVSPCGAGTFGDIPIESSTVYVDASYAAGDGDGTAAKPFPTIQAAVDAVKSASNPVVAVAAGTYTETIVVDAPLRIFGVCPEKVAIVGAGDKPAIHLRAATTLHGLGITGPGVGVHVDGTTATVENSWIHDTGGVGLLPETTIGHPAELTLQGSLVENATKQAILVHSAKVSVDRCELRGTHEGATSATHAGILMPPESGFGVSSLTVKQSSLTANLENGIADFGWKAVIESTLIRGTLARSDGLFGTAALAIAHDDGTAADMTIRGSVFDNNRMTGVLVQGAKISLADTVVRDTQSTGDGRYGEGLTAQPNTSNKTSSVVTVDHSLFDHNRSSGLTVFGVPATVTRTIARDTQVNTKTKQQGTGFGGQAAQGHAGDLTIRDCLVEKNHMAGILLIGSKGTIEGTVVRDTQPQNNKAMGRGIVAQDDVMTKQPSSLDLRTTLLQGNVEVSVLILGANATLDTVVVRDTAADAKASKFGLGVVVTRGPGTGTPSTLSLVRSLLERNIGGGLYLEATDGTVEATTIRDTSAQPADGLLGRGISVQADGAGNPASLVLRDSTILRSVEAGVSVFDASATLERVSVVATAARPDGLFGDGIFVHGTAGDGFHLVSSHVDKSARASMSAFGGAASLAGSMLTCSAFDIDIEPLGDAQPAVEDAGGNLCGCDSMTSCHAQGANLGPVDRMPPPPTR